MFLRLIFDSGLVNGTLIECPLPCSRHFIASRHPLSRRFFFSFCFGEPSSVRRAASESVPYSLRSAGRCLSPANKGHLRGCLSFFFFAESTPWPPDQTIFPRSIPLPIRLPLSLLFEVALDSSCVFSRLSLKGVRPGVAFPCLGG